MKEQTYTIVVDEGDGHHYPIFNQPESTIRELGLPLPRSRPPSARHVEEPEFYIEKTAMGGITGTKNPEMEKKQGPHQDDDAEPILTRRDYLATFKGVR